MTLLRLMRPRPGDIISMGALSRKEARGTPVGREPSGSRPETVPGGVPSPAEV